VVVACDDDHVYAVNSDGTERWVYSDCVIDDAISATSHITLDFSPPPMFSSITPVDIGGGNAPELLMGEQDGVLAIQADGSTHWADKGTTDGYYFSSIAVCDLEGDYAGVDAEGEFIGYREDLEIVLGSDDDANADAFIECWQANGLEVFRMGMTSIEHAFMTCSIVAAELDGYLNLEDGAPEWVKENDPETLYADFLLSTHAYPGRIWKHDSGIGTETEYHEAYTVGEHFDTHQTYGTPAVGNFTGGPELECIIGYVSGHQWDQSPGAVMMYRGDGSEVGSRFVIDSVPGGLISSPAACDAQNLDEKDLDEDEVIEYEVYFGCDNGYVYCLSAKDLTEKWSYQTGGRIISSPAVCNINSDDSLEIVIGSDDGKIYCFEADPMEIDRDGEPNPKDDGYVDDGGDVGTYDILWVFDTNLEEGSSGEISISSPVVGDIDYDGQLDVLIGDTSGTLYCISAGGTCVPGQVDWPMFHGDLNKTGYYNPGTSYGVRVEPQIFKDDPSGPKKELLKKSVEPGDTATYNITVTNIGTSKTYADADTFWLHVNSLVYKGGEVVTDPEWPDPVITGEDLKWTGGGNPFVTLISFQQTNITLSVTAPWSGDLSEFIQVEVEANSSMDQWARDSVQTTTSLEIFLDFEIDILREPIQDKESDLYGQKVIKINPSDRANVEVSIKNKGNLNDSYDLRLEGHQYYPGWEAYFDKSDSPNYDNAFQLDAEIMAEQFPSVYRGSEGELTFTVTAPPDAQENEILTLKVIAVSRYSQATTLVDNITRFDYLILEVNPVPDLELECENPQQYIMAGENITFEVDVINRGNAIIKVKLENRHQLEPGWNIKFLNELGLPFADGNNIVEVMNAGVTKVNVVVYAPTTAEAGSRQNIIVQGTTILQEGMTLQSTDTVALTAIVSQFFDVNVTVTPAAEHKEDVDEYGVLHIDPGSLVTYDIKIMNDGNGDDFVIITPLLLEVNWEATFKLEGIEKVTSELDYNESVTFQMEITIPRDQLAGIYSTGINVSSIGDKEVIYFDTEINQIYNLSVYGVVHSEETSDKKLESTIKPEPGVSPGSILHYVLEVTNGGNAPDEIEMTLESVSEDWGDWEGIFLGITNTEAYMTEVETWNFADSLDMSVHTSPVGFLNENLDTTLHRIKINLGVGQTIWVKVQLVVPREIAVSDTGKVRNFNVKGQSTDPDGVMKDENGNDNEVSLVLTLLFPDLVVTSGIRHPSQISNGEIVTISAEIKNDGEIEAREVLVTFYVDGKEVKTQTINLLTEGSSRLIPFTWQAAGGQHELKIKVDPENAIVEKNENNNEKSKDVNVETDALAELLSNRSVCSIIPIIIVAIILLIIIIIIKKRGSLFGWKPGGGGEEEY